ncbi:antitermination protein [Klebsiella pneumoniae]|nr:antitermination protein [Klebsiella pneumoniae]
MKLEASLKHFSPQGMDISDVVNKTGAENDA